MESLRRSSSPSCRWGRRFTGNSPASSVTSAERGAELVWESLSHLKTTQVDPLPKSKPDAPTFVDIMRHEERPMPPETAPPPLIKVGDSLRKPHAALAKLQEKLRGPKGQDYESVRGDGHAVFKAWGASRKRGLLILDALFKALEARGHDVQFGNSRWKRDRHALSVTVTGKPAVEVWLVEHLDRSDHVPTEEERRQKEKYSWSFAPKYDFENSGRLFLEIDAPRGSESGGPTAGERLEAGGDRESFP